MNTDDHRPVVWLGKSLLGAAAMYRTVCGIWWDFRLVDDLEDELIFAEEVERYEKICTERMAAEVVDAALVVADSEMEMKNDVADASLAVADSEKKIKNTIYPISLYLDCNPSYIKGLFQDH